MVTTYSEVTMMKVMSSFLVQGIYDLILTYVGAYIRFRTEGTVSLDEVF
jgi:hypothetical protein